MSKFPPPPPLQKLLYMTHIRLQCKKAYLSAYASDPDLYQLVIYFNKLKQLDYEIESGSYKIPLHELIKEIELTNSYITLFLETHEYHK